MASPLGLRFWPVPYSQLTLATNREVEISVGAGSVKKKEEEVYELLEINIRTVVLDVLANCAGVREISPLLDLSFEDWQRTMGINVTGSFLPSQAFARRLIALGKPGRIVNIASTLGLVATPERVAYVTFKHAVEGRTKALAFELAPRCIRVNAVVPGFLRNPMNELTFQDSEIRQQLRHTHHKGRT